MQNQLSPFTARVSNIDGRPMVSSLAVAEHFEKEHFHVLRDIRDLNLDEVDPGFAASNFGFSEYIDSTGRKLPTYNMTKDGFSLLVMGYTGEKATRFKIAYIKKFNEMEAALKKTKVFGYQMPSTILELRWVLMCPRICWSLNRRYLGIMADSADLDPAARAAFTRGIGIADDAMRTSTRPEGPEAWRRFWRLWKDLEDERLDAKQEALPHF